MAQIRTIKGKQGTKYKAVVRRTGYKDEYRTFPTKTEAQEWSSDLERDIRDRKVDPHRLSQRKRLMDAVDIYLPKIADTKNYKDSLRLCSWWKNKLGTSPSPTSQPSALTSALIVSKTVQAPRRIVIWALSVAV